MYRSVCTESDTFEFRLSLVVLISVIGLISVNVRFFFFQAEDGIRDTEL